MKLGKFVAGVLLLIIAGQALAYDSKQAMIDDKLRILAEADERSKIKMLQNLQWSGLSDERLFDRIAEAPRRDYLEKSFNSGDLDLLAHQIRALGYSGNPRYREFLEAAKASAGNSKLKRHARNAVKDLANYERWNAVVAASDFQASGKSFEVTTYMKMVNSDDAPVQRMAARAVFHERRSDPELLEMIADKLYSGYSVEGLDGTTQDTMAWFCKALGQNDREKYAALLTEVRDQTPYRKISKWAHKYAP